MCYIELYSHTEVKYQKHRMTEIHIHMSIVLFFICMRTLLTDVQPIHY